jgi:hypothetical protein
MATAARNLIDGAFGRGVASLRALMGLNQKDLAEAVRDRFGDDFPLTQGKLSEIETGTRPLKAREMEFFVVFFTERTGLEEEEVRRRLRPHGLSLVRGSGEADNGTRGGTTTSFSRDRRAA